MNDEALEEKPKWLTDIQNNSWEPEIILSGLTITFLFIMDDPLYNFFAMLIQEYGIGIIGETTFIMAVHSLNAIIVVLIFHLLLRSLWVGMIGLSYVYPQGINPSRLPKFQQGYHMDNAIDYVISIERICSLLFAFIFTIIGTFASVCIVYAPILAIEIWVSDHSLHLPLSAIYVFVILVPPGVLSMYQKDKKWVQMINNHFLNATFYTIQSNNGSRFAFILLAILVLISLPMSQQELNRLKVLTNKSTQTDLLDMPLLQDRHYQDVRQKNLRIGKAVIDSKNVSGDHLELFIAFYRRDVYSFDSIKNGNRAKEADDQIKDIESWSEKGLSGLFELSIDGKPIDNAQWAISQTAGLNQTGYHVRIPISHLKPGMHRLQVDKYLSEKEEGYYVKVNRWDNLVFYINK